MHTPKHKVIRLHEADCWVVASTLGDNELPELTAFRTKREADEWKQDNKPTALDRIILKYEHMGLRNPFKKSRRSK